MELEELYKVRIERRNAVSSARLELRDLEINLESIELQIEEKDLFMSGMLMLPPLPYEQQKYLVLLTQHPPR